MIRVHGDVAPLPFEELNPNSTKQLCYSVLTDFLREARPPRPKPFARRFETAPGRQGQVDVAQFKTAFTDEPGVERILWLFTMILGHSRWLWGRFGATQDLQTVPSCAATATPSPRWAARRRSCSTTA